MNIDFGTRVHSHDNQEMGRIKHLILDVPSGKVKTIVVEKGLFFTEDIEIPLEAIERIGEKEITLNYTADQVKDLPHFDKKRYTEAPDEHIQPYFGSPVGSLLWPGGTSFTTSPSGLYPTAVAVPNSDGEASESSESEEIRRRVERENAVITVGSDVISRDGEKVGEVDNVIFDAETGWPSTIVISKGYLFTELVDIPAESIDSVDDDAIYLKITKEDLKMARREPESLMF
jgi:uncharacterized protein YrrD